MKKFGLSVTLPAALIVAGATFATHAVADQPMVTKAPPPAAAAAPPPTCDSLPAFFLTNCPLTWYGVTVYGAVDMGFGYQTHGAPFDPNFVTGASYFLQKMNRSAMWGLAPSGLSQSNIGIKINEPFAPGWSFVADLNAGFDPYSMRFANSPGSLYSNNGVPLNQQTTNGDSSRAGQFYNNTGYLGVSSATFGTLTVFRQQALSNEGTVAYDPMGGSYAFSPIGFSGTVGGGGDTENARYSSAVKYRVNIGDFRAAALVQFGGYSLNNGSNGAYEGQLGGDLTHFGPGILSLDSIAGYNKDAVSLGYAGCPACINGVPQAPFLPQVLTATISDNTNVMALAKYSFNTIPLKLYAGYEWMQFAPPSDPQTGFITIVGNGIGAGYPGTGISNTAYSANCSTPACSDKILQAMWVGAKYTVVKDVNVIAAYYHYIQNTFTTASCAIPQAHSQCAGTMDAASAVIDWQFLPKWDVYLGTFYSSFAGGLANGYLATNNLATTAGVRYRF